MRNALIGLLLLSGCAATPAPGPRYIPMDLSPELRASTESGLRSVMKDPESARFGIMMASEGPDIILVCGYVNGRNSFGGYTGEKPFMAFMGRDGRFINASIGDSENSVLAHIKTCRDSDIPI